MLKFEVFGVSSVPRVRVLPSGRDQPQLLGSGFPRMCPGFQKLSPDRSVKFLWSFPDVLPNYCSVTDLSLAFPSSCFTDQGGDSLRAGFH